MPDYSDTVLSMIRRKYKHMTNVERTVADFFLSEPPPEILSLQEITSRLYVSKASLSRFAQEMGFDGFREFIYQYKRDREALAQDSALSKPSSDVFSDYQYLLNQARMQIDEADIQKAINIIKDSKRIFIYGDGLSGYAAGEFMVRFKRLGFSVESYTSGFMMQTSSAIVPEDSLTIGISLSGNTRNTLISLRNAYKNGSKTILITSNRSLRDKYPYFDAILYTSSLPNMNMGMMISPQYPVLIIIDLLFKGLVSSSPETYLLKYRETHKALYINWAENEAHTTTDLLSEPEKE